LQIVATGGSTLHPRRNRLKAGNDYSAAEREWVRQFNAQAHAFCAANAARMESVFSGIKVLIWDLVRERRNLRRRLRRHGR
jgi:hypothetical protein